MRKQRVFILATWSAILFLYALPTFAQSVDTAWVRRYDGPGNARDEACAIAVDGSGNVYVAGRSWADYNSMYDYAIIKYYPEGDTAWVRRYNGPGNNDDKAWAIAVDPSDNIYVTGQSEGSGTSDDYATIKYHPDGDTAWVRRYNGSENRFEGATAIAVDGSGNVYVTGRCNHDMYLRDGDYATIKYYPNGDTAWVRTYNGPADTTDHACAIALDASGNIYVTGYSQGVGTGLDYATIKYYPGGDTAWVRRYDGPENSYDGPSAIAADGSGNVYVTGTSAGSGTKDDYATIKYLPNGDTAWVRRYNGPVDGSWDLASAIAVDGFGNVYVTGYSSHGSSSDYATVKYDADGYKRWVRFYNGTGDRDDKANAITVDDSGNVFVTGVSYGAETLHDYATIKYYPNGDTAWVRRYNGPIGGGWDLASAIAVDGFGNVYVTGESYGSGTITDYATIKYVQFLRGDVNRDGMIDIEDVTYLIDYLFRYGPTPIPILEVGNTNCDEEIDVEDVVYLINYIFRYEPPPMC